MQQNGIVWISRETLSQIEAEAERLFPVETGGVLIGYWVKPFKEVVITHATGPGTKAVHKSHSFLPDGEYQEAEIKRHYQDSGRIHTYLGDWHSHGAGEAYLSHIDKKTL